MASWLEVVTSTTVEMSSRCNVAETISEGGATNLLVVLDSSDSELLDSELLDLVLPDFDETTLTSSGHAPPASSSELLDSELLDLLDLELLDLLDLDLELELPPIVARGHASSGEVQPFMAPVIDSEDALDVLLEDLLDLLDFEPLDLLDFELLDQELADQDLPQEVELGVGWLLSLGLFDGCALMLGTELTEGSVEGSLDDDGLLEADGPSEGTLDDVGLLDTDGASVLCVRPFMRPIMLDPVLDTPVC